MASPCSSATGFAAGISTDRPDSAITPQAKLVVTAGAEDRWVLPLGVWPLLVALNTAGGVVFMCSSVLA